MAEPKFVIQGVDYEVPGFDTFSMDEAQILYELTGLTLEDFDENAEAELKLSPGLLRTMMLVALMRGNPKMGRAAADKIAGQVKQLDAIEYLAGDEDDAVPPTSPEMSGSGSSSDSSANSSGPSSENGSAAHQESSRPTDTGTPASGTPHTSDPATLAGSLQ